MAQPTVSTLSLTPREELRRIIEAKSFAQQDEAVYKLASGKLSKFYFDMKPTMLSPRGAYLLAEHVLDIAREHGAGFVGGLEMGAVPVLVATVTRSEALGWPVKGFYVRKQAKDHGTKKLVEGYCEAGASHLVVEDVTTSGASALQAIKAVRELGCSVKAVATIIDREEGAADLLAAEGVELIPLFRTSDFARA